MSNAVEHTPKHCDDYIDDIEQPKCLRQFLRFCRWPAIYQLKAYSLFKMGKPPLFADWQRYKNKKVRVKVVMASRFGDSMSYMRKTLDTLIEEAENRRGQKLGPTAIIQLEEDFRTFSWGLTDAKDSKMEEKKSRKIAP